MSHNHGVDVLEPVLGVARESVFQNAVVDVLVGPRVVVFSPKIHGEFLQQQKRN